MTILFAWLIDRFFGEPPSPLHPVVWIGGYLRTVRKFLRPSRSMGGLAWLAGAIFVVIVAWFASWLISVLLNFLSPFPMLHAIGVALLGGLLLKPLFAWRALRQAGEAVLNAPDLSEARRLLSWHLVSRDTSMLNESEVYGATIESITENLSDSLIAPLFYFAIGGLPLAAFYRYANTADALWGYRTPALERFGKVAARADDVLNWIPARLTALLLVITTLLLGMNWLRALRLWREDGRITPSPNAGQPMSVAAGAFGICLRKRGVYNIGSEFPDPTRADLERALRWAEVAAWLGVGLFIVICW